MYWNPPDEVFSKVDSFFGPTGSAIRRAKRRALPSRVSSQSTQSQTDYGSQMQHVVLNELCASANFSWSQILGEVIATKRLGPYRQKLMHKAASDGLVASALRLLRLGGWQLDAEGNRYLHKAVAGGHLSVSVALLDARADISLLRGEGPRKQTALHVAAQYTVEHGNDELYNALVNYGADSNAQDDLGKTPGEVLRESMLAEAAFNGDSEAVLNLLSQKLDPNAGASAWRARDCKGTCKSPLILAIQEGHPDVVKILLAEGAVTNTNPAMQMRAETQPLHLAVQSGNEVIVGLLLLARADPCVRVHIDDSDRDSDWWLPNRSTDLLTIAIQEGHAGIVRQFLGTGVVSNPMLLMEKVLACRHPAVLALLLDARADPNGSVRTCEGFDEDERIQMFCDGLPLNLALHSPEFISMLLEARADPSAAHTRDTIAYNVSEDWHGRYGSQVTVFPAPLICALHHGNLTAATLLLKARARLDLDCHDHRLKLSHKILWLEVAAAQGSLAIVDELISARIDPTITLHELCRPSMWDLTTDRIAWASANIGMEVLVQRHELQIINGPSDRWCPFQSLKICNQKRCNFTLLHWASWRGHLKVLSVLIRARADPNLYAEQWHRDASSIYEPRETPAVKALLENTADPGTANPLQAAIKEACGFGNRMPSRRHWRVVQHLLAASASPYSMLWQELWFANDETLICNLLLLAATKACETTIINELLAAAQLGNG